MMRRHATISDIARQAGVSVGTVSNIINNKGRHTERTRKHVLQVAAEMHFTPNALIRSLQSGSTHTIGIFTWRIGSNASQNIAIRLLEGVASAISTIQYDALLYSHYPHEGEVPPAFFLDGRVDGLIISPGGLSDQGLKALAASRLPIVALYHSPLPEGLGYVGIDNVSGVLAAVDHLVTLGHRRIAACIPPYTFDFNERLMGYEVGLRQQGIPIDPALKVTNGDDLYTEASKAIDPLFELPDPPTAIIAGDDYLAFVILEVLKRRGIRVPQDLSLVGFDDAPASISAGLTTVRQPAEKIGHLAAEFVYRLIMGEPAEMCRATLPVEFVVRQSTAPPRD